MPENLVSRDGFSRSVPRQLAHLHTQAESGAYLRDSSRVPRRRPFMKTSYAIGSVPSLSGQAIAYRGRSLPRVRRHRTSKPQGSSERVLPWQVTMDQLIFASLSHTHYWYQVGMLKVPAVYEAVEKPSSTATGDQRFETRCTVAEYFTTNIKSTSRSVTLSAGFTFSNPTATGEGYSPMHLMPATFFCRDAHAGLPMTMNTARR